MNLGFAEIKLSNPFKKKKPELKLDYPMHFLMVVYSPYAAEDGTEDDSNKLIIRRYVDKFGYYVDETYRYSKERLNALQTTYGIPVIDKTDEMPKLPVFGRIFPGEIRFISK